MNAHRGNKSLLSVMLNTLLLYPDHPYGIGPIWGKQYDPKEGRLTTGYPLHALRQASRRSWRIGQKHPVRVKFLAYRGTMQEACIRHMGKKMLVALMMEGKFSGEGLQSLDADEDMLTAQARELVEKGSVGESAEAVWRDLERERSKHTAELPPPFVEVSTVRQVLSEDCKTVLSSPLRLRFRTLVASNSFNHRYRVGSVGISAVANRTHGRRTAQSFG